MSIDDSIEKAFKDLDSRQYDEIARSLGGYYKALTDAGFSDKQAFEFTKLYIQFIYRVSEDEIYNRTQKKFDLGDDEDIL